MQVRYQAALRPELVDFTRSRGCSALKLLQHGAQLALDGGHVDAGGRRAAAVAGRRRLGLVFVSARRVQAVARAADGEALLVEQLADAADEQHFVVLVVTAV